MITAEDNERIAQRFYDAICRQDFGTLLRDIYAPNAEIWHNTDGLTISPAENVEAIKQLAAAVNRYRYDIVRRIDHEGGFVLKFIMNVELKSGEMMSVPVCGIFDIKDHRITRLEEYYDTAAILPFLG